MSENATTTAPKAKAQKATELKTKAKATLGKTPRKHKRKTSFRPYIYRLMHQKCKERGIEAVRIKESTIKTLDTLVHKVVARLVPVFNEAMLMTKRATLSHRIVDTCVLSSSMRTLGKYSYEFSRARRNQFVASLAKPAETASA